MEKLLLISVLSLGSYLVWHYQKYGMSFSISATFQTLIGWERMLFTLTLWFTALPIIMVGIDKVPNGMPEILFFAAGACIFLVGAAPVYWKSETASDRQQARMHYIGSYGGIGLGMVASLVYFTSLSTWIIVGAYAVFVLAQMVLKWSFKNYVYWVEIAAFLLTIFLIFTQ
jgi:hypothetical protein